jgi:hypothetical protein
MKLRRPDACPGGRRRHRGSETSTRCQTCCKGCGFDAFLDVEEALGDAAGTSYEQVIIGCFSVANQRIGVSS